jgi:putative membrane protein
MRKDRFGRYLPILTVATAMVVTPAISRAQSTTEKAESAVSGTAEKAESAVSDTAEKAKTLVAGAPAGTTTDVLSQMHEADQTEIEVGKLAATKGSTPEVKSYGKKLMEDHSAADRKVEALARNEGIELSPPTAPSAVLQKKQNHDGAVKEMLANVSGDTFDRDFLEAMAKDHQETIEDLTTAMNSTSDPQLKALIAEMLPKLKEHKEMADKLLAAAKKSS